MTPAHIWRLPTQQSLANLWLVELGSKGDRHLWMKDGNWSRGWKDRPAPPNISCELVLKVPWGSAFLRHGDEREIYWEMKAAILETNQSLFQVGWNSQDLQDGASPRIFPEHGVLGFSDALSRSEGSCPLWKILPFLLREPRSLHSSIQVGFVNWDSGLNLLPIWPVLP